jgi:hypothetical protein
MGGFCFRERESIAELTSQNREHLVRPEIVVYLFYQNSTAKAGRNSDGNDDK